MGKKDDTAWNPGGKVGKAKGAGLEPSLYVKVEERPTWCRAGDWPAQSLETRRSSRGDPGKHDCLEEKMGWSFACGNLPANPKSKQRPPL